MPLTTNEAFKVGFLTRCAEVGLSQAEIVQAVKTAQDKLASLGSAIGNVVGSVANTATSVGVPTALIAPPVLGGLAGYGLAKATDIDDTDVKEIQDRELLDVYKAETDKLKRQQAVRSFRKNQAQQYRPYYG